MTSVLTLRAVSQARKCHLLHDKKTLWRPLFLLEILCQNQCPINHSSPLSSTPPAHTEHTGSFWSWRVSKLWGNMHTLWTPLVPLATSQTTEFCTNWEGACVSHSPVPALLPALVTLITRFLPSRSPVFPSLLYHIQLLGLDVKCTWTFTCQLGLVFSKTVGPLRRPSLAREVSF